MADTRDEEELRKRITTLLAAGAAVVLTDNVKREMDSGTYATVLTATVWEDRLLGLTQSIRVPNRTLWLMTGNNLRLGSEITRRSVAVRLDPRTDQPWERTGFRHDPLATWVAEDRHELVWALLVLARHWIALERPRWQGRAMGSFEDWCGTVGGILEAAGIEGFLGNREQQYRRADPESSEWRTFLQVWWDTFHDQEVKTADLFPLVQQHELLPTVFKHARAEAGERALKTRLGIAIRSHLDRAFGDLFIKEGGEDRTGAAHFRLERAAPRTTGAEPSPAADQGSAQVPRGFAPILGTNAEPAVPAVPFSAPYAQGEKKTRDIPGDTHIFIPQKKEGGFEVMQVMQVPRSGTKSAPLGAEPSPNEHPKGSAQVPRTPQASSLPWDGFLDEVGDDDAQPR